MYFYLLFKFWKFCIRALTNRRLWQMRTEINQISFNNLWLHNFSANRSQLYFLWIMWTLCGLRFAMLFGVTVFVCMRVIVCVRVCLCLWARARKYRVLSIYWILSIWYDKWIWRQFAEEFTFYLNISIFLIWKLFLFNFVLFFVSGIGVVALWTSRVELSWVEIDWLIDWVDLRVDWLIDWLTDWIDLIWKYIASHPCESLNVCSGNP